MASNRYVIEYAKTGRSGCKNTKCKGKIEAGALRIGKVSPNPFGDGDMNAWYHAACIFDALSRARADTKKIESAASFESGWSDIKPEDQKKVEEWIAGKNLPTLKSAPKKKKKAASSDDEGDDSESDKPKKKAKAAAKKKAPKKKQADSDDDGDASDEVVSKPTKRGPPKSRS